MGDDVLAAALEREHHEIDAGIAVFTSGLAAGMRDSEPLTRAMDGLRRHIYLEEKFVFPPLRAAGLMAPILVMLREHGEIWQTLDRLEAEMRDDVASDDVQHICSELATQLDRHNSKEESIVYPQADTALAPEVKDALSRFMDAGELPAGWVCEQARS